MQLSYLLYSVLSIVCEADCICLYSMYYPHLHITCAHDNDFEQNIIEIETHTTNLNFY